jgi:hypothetical protein
MEIVALSCACVEMMADEEREAEAHQWAASLVDLGGFKTS